MLIRFNRKHIDEGKCEKKMYLEKCLKIPKYIIVLLFLFSYDYAKSFDIFTYIFPHFVNPNIK